MSLKHQFRKNDDIKKPIKIEFPHFLRKVNKRYCIIENNFLKKLNVLETRLSLFFGNQRYGKEELVYRHYTKEDFRKAGIKVKYDKVQNSIKHLESLNLIKINEEGFIAYNYLYDAQKKTKFVKLPSKLVNLVSEKVIKRNEIKVLFALLLILYSDCKNGINEMGTNKKRITTKQIAKLSGITRRSVRRNLGKLKEKKIIDYKAEKGKNKGNLYRIEYEDIKSKKSSSKKQVPKTKVNDQSKIVKERTKKSNQVSNKDNLTNLLNRAV